MYFVIIRPNQNEEKKRLATIESLKKGDKIITSGGFIVTVEKAEDTFFSVKLNDNTIAKITKQSIVRKLEDEA